MRSWALLLRLFLMLSYGGLCFRLCVDMIEAMIQETPSVDREQDVLN